MGYLERDGYQKEHIDIENQSHEMSSIMFHCSSGLYLFVYSCPVLDALMLSS